MVQLAAFAALPSSAAPDVASRCAPAPSRPSPQAVLRNVKGQNVRSVGAPTSKKHLGTTGSKQNESASIRQLRRPVFEQPLVSDDFVIRFQSAIFRTDLDPPRPRVALPSGGFCLDGPADAQIVYPGRSSCLAPNTAKPNPRALFGRVSDVPSRRQSARVLFG
jgi:hypothetical protein